MRILYLDCGMGAAGDMLTAALLELLPDPAGFVRKLNGLGLPDVEVVREKAVKCGITGTHVSVLVHGGEEGDAHHDHGHGQHEYEGSDHGHGQHEHEGSDHGHTHHAHEHPDHAHGHHHSSMHDIERIIEKMGLPRKVEEDIRAVYGLIAEAESHVHGVPVAEIHFHEVGTMDAIADIAAVCLLLDELAPDEIVVSPIHVGSGHVKCAHGTLPVPAPATAYILRDVPVYGGSVQGELCTPTGAALLKHFATRFAEMPVMKTQAIGYGMGRKDFEEANCVRAMLGESGDGTDGVLELSCNVDDMTAEEIGFAMERLFEGGANEVYTIPIGMKKSRPGTLIRVMCKEKDREKMLQLLFRHTTTIGVRESVAKRYVLNRRIESLSTEYGEIRRKISSGYGVLRSKLEYDDLARIARENDLSIEDVRERFGKS